jgi:hypothetical protein
MRPVQVPNLLHFPVSFRLLLAGEIWWDGLRPRLTGAWLLTRETHRQLGADGVYLGGGVRAGQDTHPGEQIRNGCRW